MGDWVLIAIAGFLGGALNAIAGGGSFLTLGALVYLGVPPAMANATGTAALLPGYMASAWRFRNDIEFPARLSPVAILCLALAGGGLGAMLLLASKGLFATLVPWLILFATAMFALGPMMIKRTVAPPAKAVAIGVLFVVCVYGGYFNGGLGIVLLAALGLLSQASLLAMNGLKNLVSVVLTSIAVAIYAAGDLVSLPYALPLGVAAITGGYAGAALAYRISAQVLRGFIIVVGLCLALAFFTRG
jgi:hypothetical protein